MLGEGPVKDDGVPECECLFSRKRTTLYYPPSRLAPGTHPESNLLGFSAALAPKFRLCIPRTLPGRSHSLQDALGRRRKLSRCFRTLPEAARKLPHFSRRSPSRSDAPQAFPNVPGCSWASPGDPRGSSVHQALHGAPRSKEAPQKWRTLLEGLWTSSRIISVVPGCSAKLPEHSKTYPGRSPDAPGRRGARRQPPDASGSVRERPGGLRVARKR